MLSPITLNQDTRGNMTTWKGITMAATKNMKIAVDDLVLLRTSAHAHMLEKMAMTASDKTVIMSESKNAPI